MCGVNKNKGLVIIQMMTTLRKSPLGLLVGVFFFPFLMSLRTRTGKIVPESELLLNV